MVFSSSTFLFLFLPLTLLGYYLVGKRLRNGFLLCMSLLFYAWGGPKAALLMVASILINYLCGLWVGAAGGKASPWPKRLAVIAAVAANLGILFYFKYLNFAVDTARRLFHFSAQVRQIALPIGISFFTFQGMSYVLDVAMGKAKVQRNPLKIALYISLFPQLIAGPIVRYSDIEEQIDTRTVDLDKLASGVQRFAVGLVKKAWIANTLGQVADGVFGPATMNSSVGLTWLGAICYMFQIYFDFSGYSDMAIGLGKMFGFEFLENFRHPYSAKTMTEFWRRWHISLSTWFRDYVYIPMGGNRRGNQYLHQLVVFLLTGLWHGASWSFVLWGLWHGLWLMAEKPLIRRGKLDKVPGWLQWLFTMLRVLIGWVLFRRESVSGTAQILAVMFGLARPERVTYMAAWYLDGWVILTLAAAVLASVPWREVLGDRFNAWLAGDRGVLCTRVLSCLLLLFGAVLVITSTYNPFIYFRF